MGESSKKFKLLYKICAVDNSSWASVPGLVLVEAYNNTPSPPRTWLQAH